MTQKIHAKPAPRRSARPKRPRTALVLRMDPDLARWYAAAAELQGRSRTQFMERWLNVLRTLSTHMEHYQHRGVSPFDAVDVVGADFVGELIRLGLANELMKQAWELHLAEPRTNGDGKHPSAKMRRGRRD
jgi:hypothetical protein